MRTIFILMDSLNRRYLSAYGCTDVMTPNIDRLARKGVVFDNHFSASLPCMPARRDLWTGRLSFLESPWGPLQPYDIRLMDELRSHQGTYSHLITDHYHYFEERGLGYHTSFDTWEFLRGQEGDRWHPLVEDPALPEFHGHTKRQDWVNRAFFDESQEDQYPTPQCFRRAIDFLSNNHSADNWHLHLEVFDPHEPFRSPERYKRLYGDTWGNRPEFEWPDYSPVDLLTEGDEAVEHIRRCYSATLTMADTWLGKLFDKMDQLGMWDDTAVILSTDHGYMLGDRGYWGKNYTYDYPELVRIPLIVYAPNRSTPGSRTDALTSLIDISPTLLELHGVPVPGTMQGSSFLHVLNGDIVHRDTLMYGYFGKDVSITDGRMVYTRQPLPSSFAYHHTAILPRMKAGTMVENGRFLTRFPYPIYRFPVPSRRHYGAPDAHLLYDLTVDPNQTSPVHDRALEQQWEFRLCAELEAHEAPMNEFMRLGLQSE